MYFNPYAILPFVTSILAISLGSFVFNNNRKSEVNRAFFIWCIGIFIWLFSYTLSCSTHNYDLAIVLTRIGCLSVFFLPITYYNFVVNFLQLNSERKNVYIAYAILIFSAPSCLFTNSFLSGLHKYFFGFYGKAGPIYIFYMLLFALCILRTFLILLRTIKINIHPEHKNTQIKYIIASLIMATFASIDFVPKFGIEIYPFGSIFFIFWITVMTYAIVKHNLMDINIVLRKGLVYSILVAILTVFYLTLVVLVEKVFQNLIGYRSLAISISYAFIIALSFIPLRNKIQSFIDKHFFKGTREEISEENEKLRQEVIKTEKLKAVADLATGVGHEIKNPLTAIKTFAEYLPQKLDDKEFLTKFSKIVGKEVDHIDDLVHQLLEFAKPSPLELKKTNTHKLINDTLDFLNSAFIKHKIKISRNFTDHSTIADLDPNQIRQALLNILLNAIDAMPTGGTLTVSTERSGLSNQASVKTLKTDSCLLIAISDTGCGILKEELKNVLDPFYSNKDNGTGLGLSITSQIVENHNGKLRMESVEKRGTTVIIELPISSLPRTT